MADYPALPLWTDAYLADTRHLSTLEHGAYLLLMMEAWRRPTCTLPDEDIMLARLAGVSTPEWEAMKGVIMAFWKRDKRCKSWSQKRLSSERCYVAVKSKSQRDKAAKRWNKTEKDYAVALPSSCQTDAPTPTPTPIERKKEQKRENPDFCDEKIVPIEAPPEKPKGGYAFGGNTIKLNQSDFDQWRKTYHAIPDMVAELSGLDAWYRGQDEAKRKKWFNAVPGMLARKHQELLSARAPPSQPQAPYRPQFSEHHA